MKLLGVTRSASPTDRGWTRIEGSVQRASGETFEIFYEVRSSLDASLSESGNPWIVAMLPYALSTGEEVSTELPVDAALLENLEGLVATWIAWYPQFRFPKLVAPRIPFDQTSNAGHRTAVFFSGGIDSWFSVLRNMPQLEPAAIGDVDDLLTVHGFDIPLDQPSEFATLEAALERAAAELGKNLIVVRTNLRRLGTPWVKAWGWLTHGAALASVALVLEKRLGKALIGSTHPYGHLIPWGSHPMTDVLLSTRTLNVRHDGASYTRTAKTSLVARHDIALSHLHVCWKHRAADNCGNCSKCLRTMATLHMFGALERINPFPLQFDPKALAAVYLENENDIEFFEEVRALAVERGDRTIENATTRAIRRSKKWRPVFNAVERIEKLPFLWRIAPMLQRWYATSAPDPRH